MLLHMSKSKPCNYSSDSPTSLRHARQVEPMHYVFLTKSESECNILSVASGNFPSRPSIHPLLFWMMTVMVWWWQPDNNKRLVVNMHDFSKFQTRSRIFPIGLYDDDDDKSANKQTFNSSKNFIILQRVLLDSNVGMDGWCGFILQQRMGGLWTDEKLLELVLLFKF